MSFINYAGGLVLDGMQQQLTIVDRKISLLADKNLVYEMAARIIHNVSSYQTEGRRLLETKIQNHSLELNQINCTVNTLQTYSHRIIYLV